MIDINTQFQAILFGNFEDITPKPDTLKYFIDKFSSKQVIPTTRQEIDLFGHGAITNRIGLVSDDGKWNIDFGKNRIEVLRKNPEIDSKNIEDIDDFVTEVKQIVRVIENRFSKTYNRLALISSYLSPSLSTDEMKSIFNKSIHSIELFRERDIVEWSNRYVARHKASINKVEEEFNLIIELTRVKTNTKPHSITPIPKDDKGDRVELKFDINTYQGNTDFRFGSTDFKSFLTVASKLEKQMKEQYSTMLSVD